MIFYCVHEKHKIMFDTKKQLFHAWIGNKDFEAETAAEVMSAIDKEMER